MEKILYPKAPYDFALVLHYLQRSDLETVDRVEKGAFRTLLPLGEKRKRISVVSVGTVDQPALLVSVPGDSWDDDEMPMLLDHLEKRFHLQDDAAVFYRDMAGDRFLQPLLQKFYGLKPVRTGSLFEALIWAIMGQQVHIRFTYELKKTLVELAGTRLEEDGEIYFGFPEPQALAGLDYEDLTRRKFSRRKAEYLLDFAREVARGEIRLEEIAQMEPEQVIAALTKVRGIGRWTAEYGLMRGLGHPDVLPAADIGLRNALRRVYQLEKQPDEDTVREIGHAWAGWRSWAAFYLWFSLAYRRRYPDDEGWD